MVTESSNLPGDPQALQVMVEDLHKKLDSREIENKLLREQVSQLKHQLYGRKSEKYLPGDSFNQGTLFDSCDEIVEEPEKVEQITVPAHKRKKRGRKPLSKNLERVEIIHDIAKDEKQCGCGCELSVIGQETSEQLEMLPSQVWVIRHIRKKYACKNCEGVDSEEGTVKVAPAPVQLLPKSIASPSLLAHIFVNKFCYALPFYRQEQQFLHKGLSLSRSNMCNWQQKVANKLKPLEKLLQRHILSGPLVNADETTLQVLKEPDRRVDRKSYMWLFLGGPPGEKAFVYRYSETRNSSNASDFLNGYGGIIQTDGYKGYDFLDLCSGVVHAACWAHVRRKFVDVVKSAGKGQSKVGKAGEALEVIRRLYGIEKDIANRKLSISEILQERQKRSKPILKKFSDFLKELAPTVPPTSSLGKAVNYALSQWHRLIKYINHGVLTMDNNLAENAIRPFVVGRKNWLFFDKPEGASSGALLYSLIETAKANALEPHQYLWYVFDKFPHLEGEEQLKSLLPWNLNAAILNQHKKDYMKKRRDQATPKTLPQMALTL